MRVWRRSWCMGLLLLGVGAGGFGASAEEAARTLTGEIIDPATYLRDGRHGPEMEELTYDAVDGGQSLALLEDGTGTIYLLLAEEAGEDPNELAYDYVNRQVTLTGIVYERGGLRGVLATTMQGLDQPQPSAQDPSIPTPPSSAP